jgi:hypothetical protein
MDTDRHYAVATLLFGYMKSPSLRHLRDPHSVHKLAQWKEEERVKLEQRFLSGADCGWTQIDKSQAFYSRRNGRAFRIVQGKGQTLDVVSRQRDWATKASCSALTKDVVMRTRR